MEKVYIRFRLSTVAERALSFTLAMLAAQVRMGTTVFVDGVGNIQGCYRRSPLIVG